MSLSFGEIIVIIIIAILVAKPHDIKYILKQIYSLKILLQNRYHDILSSFNLDNREDDDYSDNSSIYNSDINKSEVNQMNLYLQKIAELGESYHGNYNLSSIKKYFLTIKNKSSNKKKHNKKC
ncbi:hypothetical protein OCHUTO_0945 [Orientia chuto str. Dubai]|uniref:Uncharacterized protein n=1 Tax=Orientia chuto str. Dubai TaxID=1359168 RepID=A0A0F3MHN0_9RICK|nr:DUF2672 domain-containing protein [Candidatus Orientia mediorientalis]KJV55156.1 hypothetical protein OCHUTO_0945 [Orientia chuto str. Dubai]